MADNLKLLLRLWWQPAAAMGEILDRGSLLFSIITAIGIAILLQAGPLRIPVSFYIPLLVLAVPALQTRAMLYGRDYVGAEDMEALLPHVFEHRLELGAGGAEVGEVIKDAMVAALERVAKLSMEGGR